jgi:hypothetical protein
MTRRLIFLDFDGVLHPNHCGEDAFFCRQPLLMNLLQPIGNDIRFVISSSWRHHHTYQELLAFFPEPLSRQIIGATGSAFIGKHARYQEIRAFLSDHQGWSDWRALDDAAWEFPEPCPELIRCDGAIGLTEKEIERISIWALTDRNGESLC